MNKISFQENSNYFKESRIFKAIKKAISSKVSKYADDKTLSLSIQLFMESVLKHNLDLNMIKINQCKFLSEDNSKDVFAMFSKVLEKQKNKRTYEDLKVLRIQGEVEDEIAIYCYEKEKLNLDLCEAIKKEYYLYSKK